MDGALKNKKKIFFYRNNLNRTEQKKVFNCRMFKKFPKLNKKK